MSGDAALTVNGRPVRHAAPPSVVRHLSGRRWWRDVTWHPDLEPSEAVWGWKCYWVLDNLRGAPVWPPILAGLCTETVYRTNITMARCSGEVVGAPRGARAIAAAGVERLGLPRRDQYDPFPPCRRPAGWGCPARCGLHSNVYLEEARHGVPQAVVALTASWGNVVRCDSGIGDAWRAESCQTMHLLVAEKFTTHPAAGTTEAEQRNGTLNGYQQRYRCPIDIVTDDGTADPEKGGALPMAAFVAVAERLGLPNIHRPGGPPTPAGGRERLTAAQKRR